MAPAMAAPPPPPPPSQSIVPLSPAVRAMDAPPPPAPAENAAAGPSVSRRPQAQMDSVVSSESASELPRPSEMIRRGQTRGRHPAPPWISQATWKPTSELLEGLRKEIAKSPLDRKARNMIGYSLERQREWKALLESGLEWQPFDPDNPLVYEYIGDACVGLKDRETALRAFSSIAEVSPNESGLLNRAGYLLLRAGESAMAETVFRFAIERRPDHVNNYRGLALSLWYQGRYADAVKTLVDAAGRDYQGRYGDIRRVLREETSLIVAAWTKARPGEASQAREAGASLGAEASYSNDLRVTLHWETDANDVDLHVVDPANEECYYSHKQNASGLNLYEDLTQGLGPEVAVVPPGRMEKGVYHVGVTYFSAGPMGVSRGLVVVQFPSRDGSPSVQIEPFCLLPDLAGQQQDMRHVAVVESSGN